MNKELKVLHVCFSDSLGGAFIGAHRLHSCMRAIGVDSKLLVVKKRTEDPTVLRAPLVVRALNLINRRLAKFILRAQDRDDDEVRSLNVFPSLLDRVINDSDADILQLHWVGNNTLGIKDFSRIKKPIIWKLPDMWAFCGSEHYSHYENRYIEGYSKENRPLAHTGFDIDRYCWEKKRRHWADLDLTIVGPSRWLANCASKSYLFRKYPIHNIPNPIDSDIFKPAEDVRVIKAAYQIPAGKKIILFAALSKKSYRRKGFHHFEKCMEEFAKRVDTSSYLIILLGPFAPMGSMHGIQTLSLGVVKTPEEMAKVYAIADVTVMPTQADSTPNVIKESMTCGTPCIAFDAEGVLEMISHKVNGYLVPMGDALELSNGLQWVFSQDLGLLGQSARDAALALHGHEEIVGRYLRIYENVLANTNGKFS